jgi:hypothetical protein
MYDEPRHLKDREIKSRYDDETYESLKEATCLKQPSAMGSIHVSTKSLNG